MIDPIERPVRQNQRIEAAIADALLPQPDEGIRELPLYLEPGVQYGYRLWRVEIHSDRPRLGSLFKPTVWLPRVEAHAACWDDRAIFNDKHRSPWGDGDCQCGLWAFPRRRLPFLLMWMYAALEVRPAQPSTTEAYAVGRVKLWGRIVEHERGWLAEYGYPDSLELWHPAVVRDLTPISPVQIAALFAIADDLKDDYLVDASLGSHAIPSCEDLVAARRLAERVGIIKIIVVPVDAALERKLAGVWNMARFFMILTLIGLVGALVNSLRHHPVKEIVSDAVAAVAYIVCRWELRRHKRLQLGRTLR
jgi:hypothetical protein